MQGGVEHRVMHLRVLVGGTGNGMGCGSALLKKPQVKVRNGVWIC